MPKELPRNWLALRRDWNVLTVYQRFESGVAAILTVVIAMVILIALYRLIVSVIDILVLQTRNPLEHPVFHEVFGEILTLLIALEFNHTLQYVVIRERGIIQAKVVILIAQLALVRKIIVLDPYTITPGTLAALAALVIALGITYWLMRERDDRLRLRPRPRNSERSAESQ